MMMMMMMVKYNTTQVLEETSTPQFGLPGAGHEPERWNRNQRTPQIGVPKVEPDSSQRNHREYQTARSNSYHCHCQYSFASYFSAASRYSLWLALCAHFVPQLSPSGVSVGLIIKLLCCCCCWISNHAVSAESAMKPLTLTLLEHKTRPRMLNTLVCCQLTAAAA